MYCSCRPDGERVQMIRESYPGKMALIYKWLCCACGYTKEILGEPQGNQLELLGKENT